MKKGCAKLYVQLYGAKKLEEKIKTKHYIGVAVSWVEKSISWLEKWTSHGLLLANQLIPKVHKGEHKSWLYKNLM